jgi:hypothetical protein
MISAPTIVESATTDLKKEMPEAIRSGFLVISL